MTQQISETIINSVQDLTVESAESVDEIDLIDDGVNLIFQGEETIDEVSIDFTLHEQFHPLDLSLEEQRKEIKQLASSNVTNNDFIFNGKRGYISVEEVSIPQSASESNIVVGSIDGKFFPWPKNFPNEGIPVRVISISSSISGDLDISSDLFVGRNLIGETTSNFFLGTSDSFGSGVYGGGFYGGKDPVISLNRGIVGSTDGKLVFKEDYLNLIHSLNGVFNGELSLSSSLGKLGYGNDYGYDYGEPYLGYGSDAYGDGIYGDG